MPATRFYEKVLSGKSAADATGIGVVAGGHLLPGVRELVGYVVFSAGAAAGQVLVEAAHDPTYTGTWAVLATVNFAAASRVHEVAITGPHLALRFRIASAITTGTVDAYVAGN